MRLTYDSRADASSALLEANLEIQHSSADVGRGGKCAYDATCVQVRANERASAHCGARCEQRSRSGDLRKLCGAMLQMYAGTRKLAVTHIFYTVRIWGDR